MPDKPQDPRWRTRVEDALFAEDLRHATPAARDVALHARRAAENAGMLHSTLRVCDTEARDGTRLPGCVKHYLPQPIGDWALVLQAARDHEGLHLRYLAFGERHPTRPGRPSVYAVAHRRLHAARAH